MSEATPSTMWCEDYAANLEASVRALELRAGDRVLVLRCAHERLVVPVLEALLEWHPGVTIDLLTQERFLPHLPDGPIHPVLIADGELGLETIGAAALDELHRRSYQLGLAPYGTRRGESYDNVHAVLDRLADCPFVGVGNDGVARPIECVGAEVRERRDLAERGIATTENDRRLLEFKDRHRGRRAFIIGNGPSLRIADLERLQGEITFASNKIYLAFGQTAWRPDYYTVDDVLVAENNHEEIRRQPLFKIFNLLVRAWFEGADDILYFAERPNPRRGDALDFQFAENLLTGLYSGCTVMYKQLQLAYYMGVREVVLLGLDFKFSVPPSTRRWAVNSEVLLGDGARNHFHPDYRKPGEPWTQPQLGRQRAAFEKARELFAAAGGAVQNASRQTALDVFPRANFDELFL